VYQITGSKIIGAVKNDVSFGHQCLDEGDIYPNPMGFQIHMRVSGQNKILGDFDLGFSNILDPIHELPLDIGKIYVIRVHQNQLPDARERQVRRRCTA
jgi:hypothetical protein